MLTRNNFGYMQRIICIIIIALLGLSSCRPSYMRCPKNRRCEITPSLNRPSQQFSEVNLVAKEDTSCQF